VAHLFSFDKDFQLASPHGLHENVVIPFALFGVVDREVGDGLIKLVALALVAADLRGFAGAGVSMRQCPVRTAQKIDTPR
jgi:hypothetical protein